MKQKLQALGAAFMLCATPLFAEDFAVDGIYYNITSADDKTVEVTYKGDYSEEVEEYSGSVTIPEIVTYNGNTYTVTNIGEWAFGYCNGLTSVVIPNNVTSIDVSAFSHCSGLTSVEIHNSITYIGYAVFSGCSGLKSINVAADNPIYDSRDNCNAIIETQTNTLIAGCSGTIIPNTVTSIGHDAFLDCSNLTSVEIPNSVISIGDYAFSRCSRLTSVVIPNSVISIGGDAFSDCSRLTSVEIPNSVTNIEVAAFGGCSGLTSIVVAEGNPTYDSRNNCNAIIETQTNTLIAGCSNTTIPNSVTIIGRWAFHGCSNLTSVVIPNSVTSIGDFTFSECISLTSVEIPNSVTSIGEYAFSDCSRLTSVVIPNSVTSIGNSAFCCYGLTSITSYISADKLFEIESDVFKDFDKAKCTLYVPYGAQETYAATAGWNDFTNIVEMDAPTFDLTVSSAGYATLYLDYAAKIPTGVEVYTAQAIEGDRLMMDLVEGDVLPANTGVLVKAPADTYTFNYTEPGVSEIAENLFSGSATTKYVSVPSNKTAFVLSAVDGNVGMYLAKLTDGQFLNNTNKAYLLLSKDKLGISEDEVDTSIGGIQLSLRFDFNGSTGIDGVQTETSVQGAIYDLYGRKLQSAPTNSLYIVNGKKVLVK